MSAAGPYFPSESGASTSGATNCGVPVRVLHTIPSWTPFARPKVRQLRHAIGRQEHVPRLQIPVHHLVPVQVRQALQDLLRVAPDHTNREQLRLHSQKPRQAPGAARQAGAVLHEDLQLIGFVRRWSFCSAYFHVSRRCCAAPLHSRLCAVELYDIFAAGAA
eukprot:gene2429-biopygen1950